MLKYHDVILYKDWIWFWDYKVGEKESQKFYDLFRQQRRLRKARLKL